MTDQPRVFGSTKGRLASGASLLVLVCSMGASCSPRASLPFLSAGPTAPAVLNPAATAAEVVAAINANADRVQTYQAASASIALPESGGLALVSASIAVEKPSRFRLRGTTAITGPEIDLGSNEERFWIWARRNDPPALYTARHDQWASSPLRNDVPIEPAWLVDALGLTRVDPATVTSGPTPTGAGQVELRCRVPSAGGPRTRVLVVDAQTAEVREQHVYDSTGALAASVRADRFRYDPAVGVSLPERVRVTAPGAGLELTINTGPVILNAPVGDAGALWRMPELGDYPVYDLGSTVGATTDRAWDLAGTSPSVGAEAPLATPFAEATRPPVQAPRASSPGSVVAPRGTPAATGFTPTTTRSLPSGTASSGFVGLPSNGRSL